LTFARTRDAFLHRVTKEIVFSFFIGTFVGYMMLPSYKLYGLLYISDDSFFKVTAWVYSISNGFGRTAWGFAFDRYDYRKLAIGNVLLQLILIATIS
jgi:hypothetical protein